jgi:hypothetical protein
MFSIRMIVAKHHRIHMRHSNTWLASSLVGVRHRAWGQSFRTSIRASIPITKAIVLPGE